MYAAGQTKPIILYGECQEPESLKGKSLKTLQISDFNWDWEYFFFMFSNVLNKFQRFNTLLLVFPFITLIVHTFKQGNKLLS